MSVSNRRLHQLGKLAQLLLLAGAGLWLVSPLSLFLTKVAWGGTVLLNWACGLAAAGLVGICVVSSVKMKRAQQET